MQLLCEKGVLQCICLEMHRYVQALFWSPVVAESTVMQQHRLNDQVTYTARALVNPINLPIGAIREEKNVTFVAKKAKIFLTKTFLCSRLDFLDFRLGPPTLGREIRNKFCYFQRQRHCPSQFFVILPRPTRSRSPNSYRINLRFDA